MSGASKDISVWEYDILKGVEDVTNSEASRNHQLLELRQGWVTNVDVREFIDSPSLATRTALRTLAAQGYLAEKVFRSARNFRLTQRGIDRLRLPPPIDDDAIINSSGWTGILDPVQAERALAIVSEMEDICEGMISNHDRAQIMGLVRALEILLTVPEPPRAGVAALVRDPAFANIVQVATFLAALISAVRA